MAKKIHKRTVLYIILLIYVFFTLLPIYWMVITSFKHRVEQEISPPHLYPHTPTTENWLDIIAPQEWGGQLERRGAGTWFQWLVDRPFYTFTVNSVIVAIISTAVTLLIAVPAAFALARVESKRSKDILFWSFTTRIIPPIVVVLPYYVIFQTLHLLDTYWALVLMYIIYGIPLALWIIRGFFLDIPRDMEESAMVDGCSRFRSFIRILVPMMAPGIAATAVLLFIQSWNEFLFAVTLTSFESQTAPVAISLLQTDRGIFYGQQSAAALLLVIPVIIGTYAVQKYLVRGLTLGAVKG